MTTPEDLEPYKGGAPITSTNFTDLHRVATQNFLLSGKKFNNLKSIIDFTEYRAYCYKPSHGRTFHVKFSSTNPLSLPFFNHITNGTKPPTSLHNVLSFMPDDNSYAQRTHERFLETFSYYLENNLYMYPFIRDHHTAFAVWLDYLLTCDDIIYSPKYGTWLFYVK